MNGKASADIVLKNDSTREVIGELRVMDTRFKIIALPNGSNDTQHETSRGTDEVCGDAETVLFEIAGTKCGLVAAPVAVHERLPNPGDVLTKRELQIAGLVALGRVNKQIAADLHISEWTVSSHLRRIFSKLGVRSRAALAYRCASLINDALAG
jgi:DNA-binding CsgD family transcriptional regulator